MTYTHIFVHAYYPVKLFLSENYIISLGKMLIYVIIVEYSIQLVIQ